MSAAQEIDPVDEIAAALEAARLLSCFVYQRAVDLDQARPEVRDLITTSDMLDQQLDRISAAAAKVVAKAN